MIKLDSDDSFSKRGARRLADTIAEYWHGRGYSVVAEAYQMDALHWGVRSNLVNGLPRR